MTKPYDKSPSIFKIPREFLYRRLHSLAGVLFLLFLCEHLFTNSRAALIFGDQGKSFVDMVNGIHSLPYLLVLELSFIWLPLAVHVWWGIDRMRSAKLNSFATDGGAPSLQSYPRNQAFTWQRITSVILIVAIGLHVYYMRFLEQPELVNNEYIAKLSDTVVVKADTFGGAFLLVLEDTFKSLALCIAYSLFVIAAAYHGCNGLWTFAITWGISLSERARVCVRLVSNGLMLLLMFLGLVCIWGIYWVV